MYQRNKSRSSLWCYAVLVILMAFGFSVAPVFAAEGVDPKADEILRAMSTYIGQLPEFSLTADIDNEIVNLEGQKLQLSASSKIVIRRPGELYSTREGMFADVVITFDGKTLTLYGKRLNAYTRIESPGTIDDAIYGLEFATGLEAPGADLFFADPYAVLSEGLLSGEYIGTAYVDGVACHHLAFREAKVDWQLWVSTGDAPLPLKYVITSKWVTGAPQYTSRLREWNLNPKIASGQFEFTAPEGAVALETIQVNEIGELVGSEGGQ